MNDDNINIVITLSYETRISENSRNKNLYIHNILQITYTLGIYINIYYRFYFMNNLYSRYI